MVFLALAAATLVSEDLASLSAGLLVRDGVLGFVPAATACAAGVFIGDLGLWALGRLCGSLFGRWPVAAQLIGRLPIEDARRWLDDHAGVALLGSRFMPGSRLPMFVCAGVVRMPLRRFATWACVGVLLWTPLLVWFAAKTGGVVLSPMADSGAARWLTRFTFIAVLFVVLKLAIRCLANSRALTATVARWSRWEFWPMWLFYAPVGIWLLWLTVRHRGISTITASNPGIADGGVVGESKFDILSSLPARWTVPAALVDAPTANERTRQVLAVIQERDWRFPVILKPDVGQRGVGVRLIREAQDAEAYCAGQSGRILIQPYHAGPYEAGIFYYRFPDQQRGTILSITDKRFPTLVGNGRSTIEELIWAHPRYRLQAGTFLRRHARVLDRILPSGETLQLAIAGNHAQGTLFRDGWHLWTPALEQRIDEIARAYPGFFIGRFDVRYADVAALRAGDDLAIVELNGATAESTNIYDPARSLASAYRQLFTQWSLVFAIGAANRRAGAPVTDMRRLLQLLRIYAGSTPAFALSD